MAKYYLSHMSSRNRQEFGPQTWTGLRSAFKAGYVGMTYRQFRESMLAKGEVPLWDGTVVVRKNY